MPMAVSWIIHLFFMAVRWEIRTCTGTSFCLCFLPVEQMVSSKAICITGAPKGLPWPTYCSPRCTNLESILIASATARVRSRFDPISRLLPVHPLGFERRVRQPAHGNHHGLNCLLHVIEVDAAKFVA